MRGLALLASTLVFAMGVMMACSSSDTSTTAPFDASAETTTPPDPPPPPAAPPPADGGTDASTKDANGPGEAGAECSFNRDCQIALRCECDNGTCACKPGARGSGQNGITSCDSGNDCASAVCLEGPGGAFLCSDECTTPADCPPKLPRCEDIAFVGRICVRQP